MEDYPLQPEDFDQPNALAEGTEADIKIAQSRAAALNVLEDFKRENLARRRSEEALQAAVFKFNLALQATRMGVWEYDLLENKRRFDDQVCRLLGLDPKTFDGSSEAFFACVHSEDRERLKADMRQAIEAEALYQPEYRVVWPDGTEHWITTHAQLVRDQNGCSAKVIGIAWDTTEPRKVEKEYQALFREMLDGFALHEIICDEQGRPVDYRFLTVNPAFEEMTGLKAETVIGRTVSEVLPDTEHYWIETYGRVALTGEPAFFENYTKALDKHFEVTAFRPAPKQFACIFSDITERKRAVDALQAAATFKSVVLSAAGDGIAVCFAGESFPFLWFSLWNEAMVRLTGYTMDEINKSGWAQTMYPDPAVRQRATERMIRMRNGDQLQNEEWVITRRDGEKRTIAITTTSLPLASGEVGSLAIMRDVSERKQLEAVQAFLAQTGGGTADEPFFQTLARYLAQSLGMDFVCIDRLEGDGLNARTIAVWRDGHFDDNTTYTLKGTPCGDMVGKAVCCFPAGVSRLFPHAQVLQDLRAESFVGVTLFSHTGRSIGLLVVISRRPLDNRPQAETILQTVGLRAAAELERLDAEEKLREREDQYRRIVEQALMGVGISNGNQVLFANKTLLRFFGYDNFEEFSKRSILDHVAPSSYKLISDRLKMRSEGIPQPPEYEYDILAKDGSVKTLRAFSSRFAAANGVVYTQTIFQDITERKRIEEALVRSETKFRTMYQSSTDAVMMLDEKNFRDCNEATIRTFGCRDKAEFCSKHPADCSPAFQPCGTDSLTLANRQIAKALESGSNRFEWVHKRLDTGKNFPAEVLLSRMTLDERTVLQATVRDITERKQAEAELMTAKTRLEGLISVSSLIEADTKTIADHILQTIVKITDSPFGFYGFINHDETVMTIHSWSGEAMENCRMMIKPREFLIHEAGLWGEAVRRREPLIVNDYDQTHPAKKGLPEGHVRLTKLLVVPFMLKGRIVSVVAVANRSKDYDQSDVIHLTSFLHGVQAVTERKRTEAALVESERRYRGLITEIGLGFTLHELLFDESGVLADGLTLDINFAFEQITGFPAKDIVGRRAGEYMPPEDLKQWLKISSSVAASGKPAHFEFYALRLKKHLKGYAYLPEKGKIAVLFEDVTEEKKIKSLVLSQQVYVDTLLLSMTDAVFVIGPDDSVKSCNRSAAELLGRPAETLIGRPLWTLFAENEETFNRVMPGFYETLRTNSLRDYDAYLCRAEGETVAVSINCSLLAADAESAADCLLVARDVTTRRKLQDEQRSYAQRLENEVVKQTAAIRRTEERYRALFNHVNHAVLVTDVEGGVLSCNPAAERLTGRTAKEMIGGPVFRALCGVSNCDKCRELWNLARESGSATNNCDIRPASGAVLPANLLISSLRDDAGQTYALNWIVADSSEQQRLTEEARQAREYAQTVLRSHGPKGLIVGESKAAEQVRRFVAEAAPAPSAVLILGESGTGKEVVARALHLNSLRADKPFVVADCAAMAENLLESELFGHEKGAFTGAHEPKRGLAEIADGGTLFVDEIGEMPLGLQAKLLRVLEQGEFRRLGSVQDRHSDLRVLAATNRDLAKEVKEGRFRTDLFFRLNVFNIVLPPLRERLEDVPFLTQHFLDHSRVTSVGEKSVSVEALRCLQRYSWPGNVRELANVVERAVILSGPFATIKPEHLPPEIRTATVKTASPAGVRSIEESEKEAVEQALHAAHGNKTKAAEMLGISRLTLRRKLEKYKIT
jgi:PAS domain S-box-containing protein